MRALVIGYGSIGKRHIINLLEKSNIEIVVCTKKTKDRFLQKNNCKVINSLIKGIRERPDFAIISNITSHHMKTALKLAEFGIDFICEKPLSHNLNEIKKLLELVSKQHLITLMGSNFRFHPCLKKIKELIDKNEIGRIISVHAENGSYLPNWHLNEDYRFGYAARKDLGGGVVLTCIHEIDYLYWFFGPVKEVFSITGKFSDLQISADDFSSILLKFRKNIIGEVHLDYFQNPPSRWCKVVGTEGTIYWNSQVNTVKIYKNKTKKWITKFRTKNFDINLTYKNELSHFLKCIRNREHSKNDVREGYETLKIALSILKSGELKKLLLVK